jgi:nucleoid-associated protein YgaU
MKNGRFGRGFQRALAGVLLVAVALFGVGLGATGVQPADAAISSLIILNPGCDRVSTQASWNGLAGFTPNMIRVQAYQTALGPVAGLLGFADSVMFSAAFGTVAIDVPFAFSVPANTSITLLATQIEPATLGVAGAVTVSYLCTTGGGLPAPTATPVGALALRLIVCDTPVFDAPRGRAIGDNRVRAGQTWFVNPVPVRDAVGGLWTAINVSGSSLAYIPTRCVSSTGGTLPTATPTFRPPSFPTPIVPPSGQVYVVQRGDTLFRIARRFGVNLFALAAANGITNVNRIFAGQRLVIP